MKSMNGQNETHAIKQIPIRVAELLYKLLIFHKLIQEDTANFGHLSNLDILELKKITIQTMIADICRLNENGSCKPSFTHLLHIIKQKKYPIKKKDRIEEKMQKLQKTITLLKQSYHKEFILFESEDESSRTYYYLKEAIRIIHEINELFFGKRERIIFDDVRDRIVNMNEEIQKYAHTPFRSI